MNGHALKDGRPLLFRQSLLTEITGVINEYRIPTNKECQGRVLLQLLFGNNNKTRNNYLYI